MNILVTGGAGYIGSHACKALAAAGYTPVTYDNLSRGNRWAVKWGALEVGDTGDIERVRAVLRKYEPLGVMHFSAYAYVGESTQKPLLYYRNNFNSTETFLETMLEYAPLPFIFSSTCATYGLPQELPITEEHPQNPINPYGHSKLFVERLLRDLEKSHGLPSVALRYFNAAGADPEGAIGEVHSPETHLIPLALQSAMTGEPIQVYGTDYNTPDGTCVRDFVHVADIADAHVKALRHLLEGGKSCMLNLANSRGYSVKEVIAIAEDVTGRTINVQLAERRDGDPGILIGDASRSRAVLNWEPCRSDLRTQIQDAWNWIRQWSKAKNEAHD